MYQILTKTKVVSLAHRHATKVDHLARAIDRMPHESVERENSIATAHEMVTGGMQRLLVFVAFLPSVTLPAPKFTLSTSI